jgi:glycosyltransferase involved in cell wall biosynthesis
VGWSAHWPRSCDSGGHLDRLAGNPDRHVARSRSTKSIRSRSRSERRRDHRLLRGLLQRNDLAAVSRRHPAGRDASPLVAAIPGGEPPLRRGGAETAAEGASVWVQDYQLQLVPEMLHLARPDLRIGFFLHIPFPPVEIFGRLPWRRDRAGSARGRRRRIPHSAVDDELRPGGAGLRRGVGTGRGAHVRRAHHARAEVLPISIDFDEFESVAARRRDGEAVRAAQELGDPDHVLLGVDRLDYTKGIDLRLRAFESLLEAGPTCTVASCSCRWRFPAGKRWRSTRRSAERRGVRGRINGEFGRGDWTPVRYYYRGLEPPELIAHYAPPTSCW